MPLGAIHLIVSEADRSQDAVFFCGIRDAIAAIHPVRIAHFPDTEICSRCLTAYQAAYQKDVKDSEEPAPNV